MIRYKLIGGGGGALIESWSINSFETLTDPRVGASSKAKGYAKTAQDIFAMPQKSANEFFVTRRTKSI